jgi:predicted transcriptional regulator
LKPYNAIDESVEQFLRKHRVFFDKFGEVVKSRSCSTNTLAAIPNVPFWSLDKQCIGNDVPIASVKNINPRITPTYPRSGNIHMFDIILGGFEACGLAMRSDRWH